EPAPVSSVQALAPATLDRVVRACLAKDRDERWQSAADLARELKWIAEAGLQVESAPAARSSARRLFPWGIAAAAMLAALSLAWLYFRQPVAERQSIRFTIPTEARLASHVRISPDGTKVAF